MSERRAPEAPTSPLHESHLGTCRICGQSAGFACRAHFVTRIRALEAAARKVVDNAPLLPPHHLVACVAPDDIEALRSVLKGGE